MKKAIIFFFATLLLKTAIAQPVAGAPQEKPFIEVGGTSETEVTPDQIFIKITLLERYEGKDKITIEKQEQSLKTGLTDLGIELSNIQMLSAFADYRKVRSRVKDVINSRSYMLKVGTTDQLNKVYQRLDVLDVHDAYIIKADHSKILEYQKENRIKAIKAAKEKADYLLQALGKQTGALLLVTESENWVDNNPQPMYRAAKNAVQALGDLIDGESPDDISFKKIKIRSGYQVRFEILNK